MARTLGKQDYEEIGMCQKCFEHTRKIWYLQKESFDIQSGRFLKILPGRVRELFYNFYLPRMETFFEGTAAEINQQSGDRKPYTGLKKWQYNYFSKNLLGGQVCGRIEDTLKVLNMAEDVFLTFCSCKKGGGGGVDNRCLYLNHNARITRKMKVADHGRFIDKDEAREIILERRKSGHYSYIEWGLRPKVDCICNCDGYCAGISVPEIIWGQIPSMEVVVVSQPERCDPDCLACIVTCHAKAITKPPKMPVQKIDPMICKGCNLCVERCPYNVFESRPRKLYYDAMLGKKIEMVMLED
jgi:Pyruvate/2-oxoacid:ferredoxin oxidoreductase delta subunit